MAEDLRLKGKPQPLQSAASGSIDVQLPGKEPIAKPEESSRARLIEQSNIVLFGWGRGGSLEHLADKKCRSREFELRIGYNAVSQLALYTIMMTHIVNPEEIGFSSIGEIRRSVTRASQVREELEKDSPDLSKLDSILSEFLSTRLKHFGATLDHRVERRAQELCEYEKEHGYAPIVLKDTKKRLYKNINDMRVIGGPFFGSITELLGEAKNIMDRENRDPLGRPVLLARISEQIQGQAIALGVMGDPSYPDNISSEPEKQTPQSPPQTA